MTMRYRVFGEKTGLRLSELALGGAMFGTRRGYGAEPEEARRILRRYLDAGGNVIDTSETYQLGESEEIIGEALIGDRDAVLLSTKYSVGVTQAPALASVGNSRKAMIQAVEASLKRLRTDRIDLYFVHMADGVTPAEEIARGFDDLVRAGKIIYGGLSNFPAWRVAVAAVTAELRGWAPLASVQVEYSLLQRTTESELLPMAAGLGLGVLAYSPLAGGILTGKYRKGEPGRVTRRTAAAPAEEPRARATLDELLAIAGEVGATPGQVALSWVSGRGVLPVIGPRTVAQLDENLGSVAVKLDEAQRRRLDEVSEIPPVHPHDLLGAPDNQARITGNRQGLLDPLTRTVA
jgi:aryl-alcohol dehydrogenase-like predicted oxidoreductase